MFRSAYGVSPAPHDSTSNVPSELQLKQRMLKHKAELEALGDEAEDVFVQSLKPT